MITRTKHYAEPLRNYLLVTIIPGLVLLGMVVFGGRAFGRAVLEQNWQHVLISLVVACLPAFTTVLALLRMYTITIYPNGQVRFATSFSSLFVPLHALQMIRLIELPLFSRSERFVVRINFEGGSIGLATEGHPPRASIAQFDDFLATVKAMEPGIQIGDLVVPELLTAPSPDTQAEAPVALNSWSMPAYRATAPALLPLAPAAMIFSVVFVGELFSCKGNLSLCLAHLRDSGGSIGTVLLVLFLFGFAVFARYAYRGITAVYRIELIPRYRFVCRQLFNTVTLHPRDITAISSTSHWMTIHHTGGTLPVPMAMDDIETLAKTIYRLNPRVEVKLG